MSAISETAITSHSDVAGSADCALVVGMARSYTGDEGKDLGVTREMSETFSLYQSPKKRPIILLLADTDTGFSEPEIENKLHWKKATVHQTLSALVETGIVSREESRVRLTRLGHRRVEVMDLMEQAVRDLPL